MGGCLLELAGLMPRTLRDGATLNRVIDQICELSRLLDVVATIEETTVFPALERWLSQHARRVATARRHRERVERAVHGLLISSRYYLKAPSAQRAELMQNDWRQVVNEFKDWIREEELGLFERCDAELGPFASRWLGGAVELRLAARR